MVRTQVYFSAEQHATLRRAAAGEGVSMTALLRRLVDRHLLAKRGEVHDREAYFTLVGSGESGLTDVAERHDEYLAEAMGGARLR